MELTFFKYQGTGNDFVIIDNREGKISLTTKQVKHLCERRFGIGADGLMLLNTKVGYDFEMVYYNADGNESSMCGNGGRCLTQFAFDRGIVKERYKFIAIDGEHEAYFSEGWVNLKMKNVSEVATDWDSYILNTGSPHYVKPTNDVKELNVYEEGKAIRYSDKFKEEGINVNFVERIDDDRIMVRTYERGVENETLSCGTGATASALFFAQEGLGFNRINVTTLGGDLAVEFVKISECIFNNIWLCGPATYVFKGTIDIE
jgi:diaminopimelate epimerase